MGVVSGPQVSTVAVCTIVCYLFRYARALARCDLFVHHLRITTPAAGAPEWSNGRAAPTSPRFEVDPLGQYRRADPPCPRSRSQRAPTRRDHAGRRPASSRPMAAALGARQRSFSGFFDGPSPCANRDTFGTPFCALMTNALILQGVLTRVKPNSSPSEALGDLPDRPAHCNATGNLFAFIKP